MCDGDAVPTFGLTQCPLNPLDRQSSATEESDGEKAEEENPSSAKEKPGADLIDQAAAAAQIEPISVKDTEAEGRNDDQQDHVKDPRQNKGELIDQNMSSIASQEDGCFSSAGSINTEQELRLLVRYLQTDEGTGEESTVTVQKTTASFGVKMQEQVNVPPVVEATLGDSRAEETVCWDEQVVVPDAEETAVGERSEPTDQWNNNQVNWHFSAGPGLMEEVSCPLWPLPPMSYYPVLDPRGPLEGADQNIVPGEICD